MDRKRAIALGFFDGVHLGHQALLRRTAERAGERDLSPAVFTFDRSPREYVTGVPVPLLTTAAERGGTKRLMIVLISMMAEAADSTVSGVSSGREPCPPLPVKVMKKLSEAAMYFPGQTPTVPASSSSDTWRP